MARLYLCIMYFLYKQNENDIPRLPWNVKLKELTMKEFASRLFAYMIMLCVALCAVGCGGDSENDDTAGGTYGDVALPQLNGHELKFYYEYGGKLYRAMALSVTESGSPTALSYMAEMMIGVTEFGYGKTGKNKAAINMTVLFYEAVLNPGDWQDPWHEYYIELHFVPGNQGLADVTSKKNVNNNGLSQVKTEHSTWYFCIDSDQLPDKDMIDLYTGNGGGSSEGDGSSDGDEGTGTGNVTTSKSLKTKVNFVQDGEKPYINLTVTKNSTTGLPDKVGFCVGTSPKPTIENAITKLNENDECMNGFARTIGKYGNDITLKRGTTYYIRPYHKNGNKTIYYEETSVETPGKNFILIAMLTLTKYYNFNYTIKKEGTYTLGVTCKVKTATGDKYYREELKNVGKGSGSMSWDSSKSGYDLDDIYYIEFNAKDKDTGITYISDTAPGRAD